MPLIKVSAEYQTIHEFWKLGRNYDFSETFRDKIFTTELSVLAENLKTCHASKTSCQFEMF